MTTNTSQTGSGVVTNISAQVSGTINSPAHVGLNKRDIFIDKYYVEIVMFFMLLMFAIAVGAGAYKISELKSIASGIYIEANYDRIINGQLTPRDFKIMKDIDMSPDNLFKQKEAFADRYR
jgi:hypothetical protein